MDTRDKKYLHNIDMDLLGMVKNFRVHNVSQADKEALVPALNASHAGLSLFNTTSGLPEWWDGTQFMGLGSYYTKQQISALFSGATPIEGYNKASWDTAAGWGNHADAGYLTGLQISALFSGATPIEGYNKASWDTAAGWGNHADAGYLTSLPAHNHSVLDLNGFPAVAGNANKFLSTDGASLNFRALAETDIPALAYIQKTPTAAQDASLWISGTARIDNRVILGGPLSLHNSVTFPAGAANGWSFYYLTDNTFQDYVNGAWKARAYVGGNDFVQNQKAAVQPSTSFRIGGTGEITGTFAGTGTTTHAALTLNTIINQSTSATGPVYAIYYAPQVNTIAQTGAFHYSFYATVGKMYVNDYVYFPSRTYLGTNLGLNKTLMVGGDLLVKGEAIFWNTSSVSILTLNNGGAFFNTALPVVINILRSNDVVGVNIAGSNLRHIAGRPTGNAAGGDHVFEVTPAGTGSSGSTSIEGMEKMRLASSGNLTIQNLKTGLAAPATTGQVQLVITDANGIVSRTTLTVAADDAAAATAGVPVGELYITSAGKPKTRMI